MPLNYEKYAIREDKKVAEKYGHLPRCRNCGGVTYELYSQCPYCNDRQGEKPGWRPAWMAEPIIDLVEIVL